MDSAEHILITLNGVRWVDEAVASRVHSQLWVREGQSVYTDGSDALWLTPCECLVCVCEGSVWVGACVCGSARWCLNDMRALWTPADEVSSL